MTERIADGESESTAALINALRALGSPVHYEARLEQIASSIATSLDVSYCGIFIAHFGTQGFQLRAFAGTLPSGAVMRSHLQGTLDPETDSVLAQVSYAPAPTIFTAAQDRPFLGGHSCKTLGLAGAVVLPVRSDGEISGLVLALREDGPGEFTPARIETAAAVASAIGPITELEHLREHARQSWAERQAFWAMTSAALEETDLHKVLELICREARHIARAGGSAIVLLDPEEELRVVASVGDGASWADHILFHAMSSQPSSVPAEPILVDDLPGKLDIPQAELIRSVIVVPLHAHGKSIGILQIVNPTQGLHNEQLGAVAMLADRVAVVIDHFKLQDAHQHSAVFEERRRMAHELHDSVTQSIYAVTVFAEAAALLLDQKRLSDAARTLRDLRDVARMANREMRALVFELNPPDVDKLDLIDALQARLASVESRAGLATEFHYTGVGALRKDIKEGLYRIAQEALNNSMRHARASRVALRLNGYRTHVRLEVEDDGVGFTVDQERSKGGLGLRIMEERAEAIGGSISFESNAGRGTRITIDVPLDDMGDEPPVEAITV